MTVLEVRDLAFAYPDGNQALFGVNLTVTSGERIAILGPNGAGKITLGPCTSTARSAGAPAASSSTACGWRRPICARSGAGSKSCSRTPTISSSPPPSATTSPSVRPTSDIGVESSTTVFEAGTPRGGDGRPRRGDRPTTSASANAGAWRRARCCRWTPRCSSSTSPRPTSTPSPAAKFAEDRAQPLGLTTLVVTHDLRYALQLCPRAVVMNDGMIVADGPTAELLADAELMAANRLELPFGYAL